MGLGIHFAQIVVNVQLCPWDVSLQEQCRAASYCLGAVDVFGQADDQVMSDGINQVSEAGVAIQHVVQ